MEAGRPETSSKALIVIAVFKLLKASLLLIVAFELHHLLNGNAEAALTHLAREVRIDPQSRYIHAVISTATGLSPKRLQELRIGTFCYGALFMVEGLGLALRKRWAEYMTVISTTGLLPLEIYEVVHKPTPVKAVLLAGNALIVVYLVYQLYRTRSVHRR